ncbi:MAG: NAD(P)-dependent oxidoreductase [Bacteroidota bacterium]
MIYKPGKVLILDQPDPFLPHFLVENGFTVTIDTTSDFNDLKSSLAGYQGVILRSRWTLDPLFFEAASQLLFVGRLGVGTEHIDAREVIKNGIRLFTTPEGSKDTVAEHTLGLILMLLNKLGKADREIRRHIWDRNTNKAVELKGKKVGILGFGNMGRAVAQRLSGFEADILCYDLLKISGLPGYVRQVEENLFLAETEILTIHIPLNKANTFLIDYDYLKRFKKDLFIINTARGGVLETDGLVRHLKEGKVRGAALDVLEYEEQSFNSLDIGSLPAAFQYLKNAENVVLNPHLAGLSNESFSRHSRVMAQKIANLFKLEIHV